MKKNILIMAGFEGKHERIALECETRTEAENRLDKAFCKKDRNLWTDSFGQEFSIIERKEARS